MATDNPISSSCQSIATTSLGNVAAVPTSAASGSLRAGNGNGNTTHYVMGTGSLGRLKYHNKHKSVDASDEELEYPQLSRSTHILGRVKSERFLASKVNEERRRRTIIVEKKNDSFGFTLQSYGIHYKKDQEVEMITYVDYVEYDGPAYRAGMREGDVILSINGRDVEKADHKTLVDHIKSYDTRMRMVVLFEDCVHKVDLHMRYIQLQNMLQNKINELEKICIRERELLEGKWKTHSLPARKKVTTSPTDAADPCNSPTDDEMNLPYYRSTLSTEDVANIARQTQQTIIPPPAQFMLSYHYFDPHYRYVMKPSTSTNSSGDCFIAIGEPLIRAESGDTTTAPATSTHLISQRRASSAQPPVPPPRTCEKHKPPGKHQQQQHQEQQQTQHQAHKKDLNNVVHKSSKTGKHCHGHSCNPCIDFRWKSAEKSAATVTAAGNGNADNVSLDAYDLASPCCDTHCVPSRRRTRHHHKDHTHKHKHRDRDRDREHEAKERPPRPKSQSLVTSTAARHHHHHHTATDAGQHTQHSYEQPHQQQQQTHHHHYHPKAHGCDSQTGSIRSRYYDIASGLASHCSLHSCTSSEFAPVDSASYTTSISTDTLFYDPNTENPVTSRQHSTKSRQSCQQQRQAKAQQQPTPQPQQQTFRSHSHHQHQHHQYHPTQQQQQQYLQHMYQQRYHITATQVQPAQIYPNSAYVHKPKSWDNLTAANIGAYGYGYGYLDTVAMKPVVNLQIAQQRHSIPRKNPYGRYSTFTDVENYAPPPTEFVEQVTTTTTTITAKSTEELIATTQSGCDCMTPKQHQQAIKFAQLQLNQKPQISQRNNCQMGYYSHLPQPKLDATTSTSAQNVGGNVSPAGVNASTNVSGTAGTSVAATTSASDVATVTEVTRL